MTSYAGRPVCRACGHKYSIQLPEYLCRFCLLDSNISRVIGDDRPTRPALPPRS